MRKKLVSIRVIVGWSILAALGVAARVLGDWYPAPALAGLIVVAVLPMVVVLIRRERAHRWMNRWAETVGWTEIDRDSRDWPWRGLNPSGEALVKRAWTHEVDGYPVTAGEVGWSGGAFAGAVLLREGRGIFVVVRLPLPAPPMAMRLPYEFVGDSQRLNQPALRQAYLDGKIPPWTARGDEMFTIESQDAWITPDATDCAVRRALRVVQLLDLGPDVSSVPTGHFPP